MAFPGKARRAQEALLQRLSGRRRFQATNIASKGRSYDSCVAGDVNSCSYSA